MSIRTLVLYVATILAALFVAGLVFDISAIAHIALLGVSVLLLCIYSLTTD